MKATGLTWKSLWRLFTLKVIKSLCYVHPPAGIFLNSHLITPPSQSSMKSLSPLRVKTSWALFWRGQWSSQFTFLLQNQEVVAKFTSTIFENKTLIGDLNKTGYDLFLTDPTFPGGVLLAHYLQLPLVFNVRWLFSGEAHLAVAPSPVSYIPICFSHNSDKMDFFQRIRNMIHYIMVFLQGLLCLQTTISGLVWSLFWK